MSALFQLRREILTEALISLSGLQAYAISRKEAKRPRSKPTSTPIAKPVTPEDFRPLEHQCFQNPYAFYKVLRDSHPLYQLENGIYCVSRYEDIVAVSRDVETYSSTHQGVIAGLKKGQDLLAQIKQFDTLSALGIIPADVLATSDQPSHTSERKVGHGMLNARFVKKMEEEVDVLCSQMLDEFLDRGQVEFMAEFGWKLPMLLIVRLLGLPEADFPKIKQWCVHGINSQSGITSSAELIRDRSETLKFLRYCWRKYNAAKKNPQQNFIGMLVAAAADPDTDFDDKRAVSTIFQLLIAGSDSSATSMGNALKMLIENPDIQQQIRADLDLLPAFIEEVFRMESAFQGHFRWVKKDTELHGVTLEKGSRVFLMWASGNRDDRVFPNPDAIDLNRANGKKHLTFGHGIHACLGRELARIEIRIVLQQFLEKTENLEIVGDSPFIASMFARTLVQLPIRFDKRVARNDQ
ncbi:cytochrome P450 [Spongiibacter sp. KMU-158]|uniref:Cytochrome P450 n=1 Tax=Spongiibacter pelagi TaxID=2760804 RepID=A0A927C3Z0_9GAMM|nr:cytochrome P450 [Spongiibacter pelagi]MBD2859407.1 cytochrome P450 [Spongiibacter pelagi]